MPDHDDSGIADQIERDMRKLEESSTKTDTVRQKIITKLEAAVDSITFNPNDDKPMVTESKRMLVDTLLKSLNDIDTQKINLLKLKQRQQADVESEDSLKTISRTVAEFMKSIDRQVHEATSGMRPDAEGATEKILDENAAALNIEVLEGELEIGGVTAQSLVV